MLVRKGMTGAAAAVLAFGSAAWAADQSSVSADAPKVSQAAPHGLSLAPTYADDQAVTRKPLMYLLDKAGVAKPLDDLHINIFGFVEAGYFYNTNAPRLSQQPTDIAFPGLFSNRGLLDQVDLQVQRKVDTTQKNIDIGFEFENMYGTDASFIHSNGLLDNRGPKNPQNQYDITQAYLTLFLPIGDGLTLQAGKFVTLLGNETINPTGNQLYTHSYNFTFGIPFTQTGVLGTYTFGKLINGQDLTVTAGITRGWNQSFRDNNGSIDFLGELSYNVNDKLSLTVNVSEGPEAAKDNRNYWTVLECIAAYQYSDQLKLALDALYADFPHGTAPASVTGKSGNAQWYGATLYAGYKINNYATVNGRAEWYRDNDGFTTGVAANYYEATVGVDIHPLPNDPIFQYLEFRPEARYDYSDKAAFNAGHDGGRGDNSEFTAAIDAIMQF